MIFQSIRIKEGLAERSFCFTKGANLIFSHENSKGKTTLLRFMLYSLGYNIPNTRKIKFDRCEVVSRILADSVGELILSRYSNDFIEATVSGEKRTYILPDQLYDLHILRCLYACPCGQGTVEEEQDYTEGHRDCWASLECSICRNNYKVIFSDSGLSWDIVKNDSVQIEKTKEIIQNRSVYMPY